MSPTELRDAIDGEPTWDIVQLFPPQGEWTESAYLSLPTNHLVELSEGRLEFPPMPSEEHQDIVAFFYRLLFDFVTARRLGKVLFAPLKVRLWDGKIREPDLAFMLEAHAGRRENRYWQGADLVVEVVSGDDPDRDWIEKRDEYARAGIPEYWIVDPRDGTLTVFTLSAGEKTYRRAGQFSPGDTAVSVLLPGLQVNVSAAFGRE
jgi:Uma2 family endonuclease